MLKPYVQEDRGATLSQDRRYRYKLWRRWGTGRMLLWIGLNPSTADENMDDPTIRRMVAFSRDLGFDGLTTCNLFGLVSPHPEDLLRVSDPLGDNDHHLLEAAQKADAIICCWGAFNVGGRDREVVELLAGHALHCLGRNQDGSPKHPLYLPKKTKMEEYHG
jgi:hypothetical protein